MSETLCIRPWNSLGVRTHGGYCICPEMDYQAPHPHVSKVSPEAFRTSPEMNELRQNMLEGKTISACKGCKLKDEINKQSSEIHQQILTKKSSQPLALTSLRLDFGNKCNLMCPTCGMNGSSNWEKFQRELLPEQRLEMSYDWPQKNPIDYGLLSQVSQLSFSGGEPMLIEDCRNLLEQLIRDKRADHLSINYVTNATVDPTPFIPIWENFQTVILNLSIDGIGKTFEFLRNPARWDEVERNIHRFLELPENCEIYIINHVSVFNLFHLPEYFRWFKDLEKKYLGRKIYLKLMPVEYPSFFSLRSLPLELRTKGILFLKQEIPLHPEIDLSQFIAQLEEASPNEKELHFQRKVFLHTYRRFSSFDLVEIFPEIRSAL